jgi:hypothetical protein
LSSVLFVGIVFNHSLHAGGWWPRAEMGIENSEWARKKAKAQVTSVNLCTNQGTFNSAKTRRCVVTVTSMKLSKQLGLGRRNGAGV